MYEMCTLCFLLCVHCVFGKDKPPFFTALGPGKQFSDYDEQPLQLARESPTRACQTVVNAMCCITGCFAIWGWVQQLTSLVVLINQTAGVHNMERDKVVTGTTIANML